MKEQERKRPSPSPLSSTTTERLNLYALAATAAGVGILSPAPLEAKVVYTPVQVEIVGTVPLDVNNDGVADFKVIAGGFYGEHGSSSFLLVNPVNSANLVLGHQRLRFIGDPVVAAVALPSGVQVGPSRAAFQPPGKKFMGGYFEEAGTVSTFIRGFVGGFANSGETVAEHFLGFAFTIDGQTHFGWARFSIPGRRRQPNAALTGYAYETDPNTPIITGMTDSDEHASLASLPTQSQQKVQLPCLGALALGADGLALWRRERDAEPQQLPS
jgi:hypothetical protein